MVRFVCVMKSGGDYDMSYVSALSKGVQRNYPGAHSFVCLTDLVDREVDADRITLIPLIRNWPGWWSKLELFRSDLPMPWEENALTIFFDLDTILVRDISAMASYQGNFAMLRGFHMSGRAASGVMLWRGDWSKIYSAVPDKIDPKAHDQSFIAEQHGNPDFIQDFFPGICSYKWNCVRGCPTEVSVVCFHGKPRPHEVHNVKWVRRNWDAGL